MGLLLYALLILFGVRGMPLKRAKALCLITAMILTALGIGAVQPSAGMRRSQMPTSNSDHR